MADKNDKQQHCIFCDEATGSTVALLEETKVGSTYQIGVVCGECLYHTSNDLADKLIALAHYLPEVSVSVRQSMEGQTKLQDADSFAIALKGMTEEEARDAWQCAKRTHPFNG